MERLDYREDVAYEKGNNAGMAGESISTNPYKKTHLEVDWLNGWRQAVERVRYYDKIGA